MTADGPAELMLPISFTAIKFAKVTARRNAGEFPMFGNDNLITMMDGYFNKGAHIYALTPMVEPGISDFEEDIRALGEHFRNYRMIQRVEILPYHTLGKHKYESLGWEYKLEGTPSNTPQQLDRAVELFKEYFDCVILN